MSDKKLLIIDDSNTCRFVAGVDLEEKGFIILNADGGKHGVEVALKENPDLIICDLVMPEMDGIETLKVIRNTEQLKNIPVLFLSGKVNLEEEVHPYLNDNTDYLEKPYIFEDLFEKVEKLIRSA